MKEALSPIYPIINLPLKIDLEYHLEQYTKFGIKTIQLRSKHSPTELIEVYQIIKSKLDNLDSNINVIINDYIDLAIELDASGVHLGQDDCMPLEAREKLGHDKIIGFSTHNNRQFVHAQKLPINYLALGPIFQTRTKANPDPEVGLDILRTLSNSTDTPIVAIGGIKYQDIPAVLSCGASSVAMIGELETNNKNKLEDILKLNQK